MKITMTGALMLQGIDLLALPGTAAAQDDADDMYVHGTYFNCDTSQRSGKFTPHGNSRQTLPVVIKVTALM